ncbi:hypothetical protein RUM43_007975 [Polyplax serrata]|uniref:RNase H type-1 domain-containing protein n=1 Tax=Polyplax serrata TaxID=468196 RepID=A0AAN8P6F2_POLSC
MSKNGDKVYYAVVRGREIGIYNTWKDCKVQVDGVADAKFRKFFSQQEAEEFINFWKNYPSPVRNTDSRKVSSQGKQSEYARRNNSNSDKRGLSRDNKTFLKKNNFVLGHGKAGESKINLPKTFNLPYISPISGAVEPVKLYDGSSLSHENIQKVKTEKHVGDEMVVEEHEIKLEPASLENGVDVNQITSTPEVNESSLVETCLQTPKPSCLDSSNKQVTPSQSNIEDCASTLLHVLPKEKGLCVRNDIDDGGGGGGNDCCQNKQRQSNAVCSREIPEISLPQNGEKLNKCIELLSSVLKLLASEDKKKLGTLAAPLKLFVKELFPETNGTVNPQINLEEVDSGDMETSSSQKGEPPETQNISSSDPTEEGHSLISPSKYQLSSSFNSSFATDSRIEQKNADIMALNMRMDSFEKRFDACLKEVGGILSELSHLRSEVKEMKQNMSSQSSCGFNSPTKRGTIQTTLNFIGNKCDTDGLSSSKTPESSICRSYSSSLDTECCEPVAKKSKSLKRKLSDSNMKSTKCTDFDTDGLDFAKVKKEAVDYTSFTIDSEDFVHVYTDGACHSNGKKGAKAGIGIWFGDCHPLNIAEPVDGSATNNSAEIQAARVAIELAVKAGVKKLKIHTDSEFLINCVTKWIHRWKKNNWTLVDGGKVKNRTELEKLDAFASKIEVRWEKVEAHVGIKGNEMADRLANEGARKYAV